MDNFCFAELYTKKEGADDTKATADFLGAELKELLVREELQKKQQVMDLM